LLEPEMFSSFFNYQNPILSQAWWHIPVTPVLKRQRQVDRKFKPSLVYIVRHYLKMKKKILFSWSLLFHSSQSDLQIVRWIRAAIRLLLFYLSQSLTAFSIAVSQYVGCLGLSQLLPKTR
jgi:hypothetical protein